ncbi:xanthine dehydrogenase family protein subunit M [Reyranella sp. CPCC 100927]|uniref:FAD binding domain-containing protein n=1 Tax=Reyranella sp. CPCC 100927 TaxID=2599616 RepID=UPI0011B784C2|nr:xanthine dehydrogenase family protein subunit M [Reyranella sp. CPCC 100927]TWT11731.1 xanthine dehydrogenase family protein subunit M [Reyranella sp. CPCC 100927]
MNPFVYRRAIDPRGAIDMAARPDACFIAGGTDFMQLWKAGISAPNLLIDISRLPLTAVERHDGGLRIGALARMSDVADHPEVRNSYPVLAQALLASASPQIRNVATIGGNLLQRTRCLYFRSGSLPCNKREPGSGCGARDGENRLHAIFGASAQCAATHASDLAVALVALGARVLLASQNGERALLLEDFFRLPEAQPEQDTVIAPGELIASIDVPAAGTWRSYYLKVRDRASFEFAVVSAAVVLDLADDRIRTARIAAGGVGTRPWRLRGCEAALIDAAPNAATFERAARLAGEGAQPLRHNGFKMALLERTVLRALQAVRGDL